MAKFRKKPVVIEAEQYITDKLYEANDPLSIMLRESDRDVIVMPDHLIIDTLEGRHRAEDGDWIIKGIEGELYPCKPSIFKATYEPAEEIDNDS